MMMIISSKNGERIVLDESVYITIMDVTDDYVQIGIDAPNHVDIFQQEGLSDIKEPQLIKCG